MTVETMTPSRPTVFLCLIPSLMGFSVNVSSGTVMVIGSVLAWFYGQMIWRHGEAKAKAHKEWVLAQNLSLLPRLELADAERKAMRGEIQELKESLQEAIAAERDLAIGWMVSAGNMRRSDQP